MYNNKPGKSEEGIREAGKPGQEAWLMKFLEHLGKFVRLLGVASLMVPIFIAIFVVVVVRVWRDALSENRRKKR